MEIDYKALQNSDQKDVIATEYFNGAQNDNNNSDEIFHQSQQFIDGDFKDTNEIAMFLIENIPKSPEDFQNYLLSKFNFTQKLINIDMENIQKDELKLILQMIDMIISLPAFDNDKQASVFDFCITTELNLIHDYQIDDDPVNVELSLNFIAKLINKDNFHQLNQNFFEEIVSKVFFNDKISIKSAEIVEKMSNYVPKIRDFKYYFDFFKFMCNSINIIYAYHLYSTLLNLVKRYPNIIRIPNDEQKALLLNKEHSLPDFWAYEMIVNSYRYDYDIQSVAFDICSHLESDSICILKDSNIRMNILKSLKNSNNDVRAISAIHALKNFLIRDSKSCAEFYFSVENSISMAPHLINHIIESTYKVKVEAAYLICFAMTNSPEFFAKGFIEPYSKSLNIKYALKSEEEAIVNIFGFDEYDLLIRLLKGLLAIADQCMKWNVENDLFEKFNVQIIPIMNDMISNDVDKKIADLMIRLIEMLTPKSEET